MDGLVDFPPLLQSPVDYIDQAQTHNIQDEQSPELGVVNWGQNEHAGDKKSAQSCGHLNDFLEDLYYPKSDRQLIRAEEIGLSDDEAAEHWVIVA